MLSRERCPSAASCADQSSAQGESGAGLKGKTLTLGQSLHIDGSVTVWSHPQKEIFRVCLFGTAKMKMFC